MNKKMIEHLNQSNFNDFIIFMIFRSKYWKKFTIDCSTGLEFYNKQQKLELRIPNDIDINIKNKDNVEKLILEIFFEYKQNLHIEFGETREPVNNKNTLTQKIKITFQTEKEKLKAEIDLSYEQKKFKKVQLRTKLFDEDLVVQIYTIEKYLANKLLASWKKGNKTKKEKSLFDIWFILNNYQINKNTLNDNFNLMNNIDINIDDVLKNLIKEIKEQHQNYINLFTEFFEQHKVNYEAGEFISMLLEKLINF
ncbi:nucleotidyl transferase AbiEii/AbiGii toxin family protein [Mycoplasma procyoni]|uniref:nucleotidyl transferase AbiEii/AbiGii toxin family protein n=1 Tax=Mycoplasma procyoni TaxID=568784 RepID=UPI00197CA744|nr:nucleotidyl transferase AbiEii/AbiGii toxin family protein [Mycoplasma procyoni]MBN3534881.1 nucleotidyl transferase AbiEii/AbiGii toxin family protein [Mycoplasma procyoni]